MLSVTWSSGGCGRNSHLPGKIIVLSRRAKSHNEMGREKEREREQGRGDPKPGFAANDPNTRLIVGLYLWRWHLASQRISKECEECPPCGPHADGHVVEA